MPESGDRFGERPRFELRILNRREAERFVQSVGFISERKRAAAADLGAMADRGDKDKAAERVRAVNADPNASKEDKAEAEAAYKAALAALQSPSDEGAPPTGEAPSEGAETSDEEAPAEETAAEAVADEPAADPEVVAEAQAEVVAEADASAEAADVDE